jgi:hypothetical protein
MKNISNADDIIDSRDVIARIAELERELEAIHDAETEADADEGGPEPHQAIPFVDWLARVRDDN